MEILLNTANENDSTEKVTEMAFVAQVLKNADHTEQIESLFENNEILRSLLSFKKQLAALALCKERAKFTILPAGFARTLLYCRLCAKSLTMPRSRRRLTN